MTVGEALDYYLSDLSVRGKASSVRVAKIHANTVLRFLAGADPSELSVPEINRMILHLRQEGRADTGINGVLRVLRAALRLAEADRRIERAPKVKLLRETKKIPAVLTAEDVDELALHAPGPDSKLAILLAAFAGLRHQEIAHLERADIDMERRQVRVTAKDGWTPKAHAERLAPWPEKIRAALRWHLEYAALERWLFPCRDFTGQVREAFEAAGLYHPERKPGLHMLRRTFASRMLEAGATLEEVREAGGWADLATVQRYLAASPAGMRAAVERL